MCVKLIKQIREKEIRKKRIHISRIRARRIHPNPSKELTIPLGGERMDYAIKILEREREMIVSALKDGHQEKLQDLQGIDKALGWLRLLQEHDVKKASRYCFDTLPPIDGRGGFSNYRLMLDDETDDTACWDEYTKPDGSHYLLCPGDFIVEEKPSN